jgi:hypothetical protein
MNQQTINGQVLRGLRFPRVSAVSLPPIRTEHLAVFSVFAAREKRSRWKGLRCE